MSIPHNERKMAMLTEWGRLTHRLVVNKETGTWGNRSRPAIRHQATGLVLSVQLSPFHYSSGRDVPTCDDPKKIDYSTVSLCWETMVMDWGTWENKRGFGIERMGESPLDSHRDPEDYVGPFGWVRSGYIARHFTESDWKLAIKLAKYAVFGLDPYSPVPGQRGGRKIEIC